MQLRITQEIQGEEIPIFKSQVFILNVNNSINATATIPDEYPTWIDIANTKISEIDEEITKVDNLDVDANGTIVTITRKDGTTKEVETKGDTGETGQPGFSPIVNVETNGANSVVTIIDENGTTTATIHTPVRGTDYWTDNDKQTIVQDVLNSEEIQQVETNVENANTNADEAKSLARQCNKAKGYINYQGLINELNDEANDTYLIGQSFLIQTMNVPDLWVYSVEETSIPYTYVDDATLVNELQTNNYVQIGYYKVSMLETIKQDLTNYVKFNDIGSSSKAGVYKNNPYYGINLYQEYLSINKATNSLIDGKTDNFKPIVPSNFNYAMSTNYLIGTVPPTETTVSPFVGALYVDTTNNKTYQCIAINSETPSYTWVQLIRSTDYASSSISGIIKVINSLGLSMLSDGRVFIQKASNGVIDNKLNEFNPIVPANLNYAVGSVLPVMSQTEYDAITTKDENLYYMIEEEE